MKSIKGRRQGKARLRFADMPRDYAALCRVHLPRLIHDKAEYENTLEIAESFAGFEAAMTAGQKDYFDILCTLIEAWEKENVKWPDVTPVGILKHLMAQHEMSGADLSRVLGGSRQLGPMILRGERSITADHARKLGSHFAFGAGAFIEGA
jgi:HTH-type transcriptional regulator/antitoxin HigA